MFTLQVTVFTTAASTDTFDGSIFVTMSGLFGSNDENELVTDAAVSLAPGTGTDYALRDSDLGTLYSVAVRLAKTGSLDVSEGQGS